jgi:hypothetical protein
MITRSSARERNRTPPVRKHKSRPTHDYFVDWLNAFRLLWHVFVISRRRRKTPDARSGLRDVGKIGGYYWYLPLSLGSLLAW